MLFHVTGSEFSDNPREQRAILCTGSEEVAVSSVTTSLERRAAARGQRKVASDAAAQAPAAISRLIGMLIANLWKSNR